MRPSVTDRCNRCTYRMAEDMTFLPRQQILTLEELRDAASFVNWVFAKFVLQVNPQLARYSQVGRIPGGS